MKHLWWLTSWRILMILKSHGRWHDRTTHMFEVGAVDGLAMTSSGLSINWPRLLHFRHRLLPVPPRNLQLEVTVSGWGSQLAFVGVQGSVDPWRNGVGWDNAWERLIRRRTSCCIVSNSNSNLRGIPPSMNTSFPASSSRCTLLTNFIMLPRPVSGPSRRTSSADHYQGWS